MEQVDTLRGIFRSIYKMPVTAYILYIQVLMRHTVPYGTVRYGTVRAMFMG